MRIACHEQRTQEWYKAKLGIVGASQVWRALDTLSRKSKNGGPGEPSGDQLKYQEELAMEIISGAPVEHWVSTEMVDGMRLEPKARDEYLLRNDCPERAWQTGFVLHPTMDRLGASPDLLVKPRWGAEFKCPKLKTHMGYLFSYSEAKKQNLSGNDLAYAVIPEKYVYQVQTVIKCCDLDGIDWVSSFFSDDEIDDQMRDGKPWQIRPNIPEHLKHLQLSVLRDEEIIAKIEQGVEEFNERLLAYVTTVSSMLPATTDEVH